MFYYSREEKEPMTEVMLLQELLNFILAGSETTSIMFSFMLLRIFDNADVHAKLMEEIDKHLKDPQNMTFDELKKLKYWIGSNTKPSDFTIQGRSSLTVLLLKIPSLLTFPSEKAHFSTY